MKRAFVCAMFWCGSGLAVMGAEEAFSRTVPASDFAAAGLGKLSAQELARLDALVRDFKSGALEAARREVAAASEARAKAEAAAARAEEEARTVRAAATSRAEEAAEPKGERSLLARAKVLLTPGTQVEYSTLDARIVGEFHGWQPRTVFTLDNGQRWQVIGGDSYVVSGEPGPKVKIVPGVLGTFWMHVDGHRQRAKVAILSAGK